MLSSDRVGIAKQKQWDPSSSSSSSSAFPSYISGVHHSSSAFPCFISGVRHSSSSSAFLSYISGVHHSSSSAFPSYISGVHHSSSSSAFSAISLGFTILLLLLRFSAISLGVHHSSSSAFPSYISGVHHSSSSSAFSAISLGFTILLLLHSQLYLWGLPFWVRFLHMWPFFNPTIEVVTFCLHGWCMLGVLLLLAFTHLGHEHRDLLSLCDGMHVSTE